MSQSAISKVYGWKQRCPEALDQGSELFLQSNEKLCALQLPLEAVFALPDCFHHWRRRFVKVLSRVAGLTAVLWLSSAL